MAISSKKLLGSKGGSLAVRPKTNLVPIKKQSSSPAKVGGKQEDPMLVIKTKVIKIEDLLKGTLAAEKRAADEKRKQQEQEDRSKQEQDVEKTPKSKEKGIKIPVPGKIKSFWGNIKKYIGTVLFGWLALQLLPLLPKLMPIVKFLASTADFIINVGGTILNGLVTFIDWGYKAVESTEKWIGDKFGEDAAEKFNSFTGILTKTMNLVMALGIAAAAMGGKGPKGPKGKPKGKPRKKPKWQKKLQQRWKKSKLGKNVRNIQAGFKKTGRKISQAVKPKNILKNLKKSKIGSKISNVGQRATKALDSLKNLKPKNIGKSKLFKNIQGFGSDLLGKGGKILQQTGDLAVKVGKGILNSLPDFNKLGKQLGGALSDGYNGLKKSAQKNYDRIVDVAKKLKGKYDNALKGAGQYLSGVGEKAKQAFLEKVLGPVKKLLEPIIKKIHPIGDKIMGVLKKIPGYDKIGKVLQKFGGEGSQGLMKKLGGKAIPILGGVVNMAFAYDRLASGDSVGGLIEGLSGLLDLSALVGNAAGPGISMGLDAYMFARDFVPQIQGAEDTVINKLGLSGLKSSMDEIFAKLPRLGEITKMLTGGDKKDETGGVTEGGETSSKKVTIERNKEGWLSMLRSGKKGKIEQALYEMRISAVKPGEAHSDMVGNPKYAADVDLILKHGLEAVEINSGRVKLQGSANNIVSTNNSLSNKVNGVSSSASYEEGSGKEVVIINPENNSSTKSQPTEKDKVVTIDTGTGGSGSDSTASLYRG